MNHAMAWDVGIGDEVIVNATVLTLLGSGRARVRIPTHNYPCAIDPPAGAKAGDRITIAGHVTEVDHDKGRVTFKVGGLVTVDIASVAAWKSVLRDPP
ncbi:hypothetical protein EN780_27380 [Mesorhizobium sp. M4B.F.Ca.ET.089.01.1.1]|uniref:hypothetical protein n=1 Tax=Mesorhizobium sp. M4B.F.Ca.ET.089.01.1.1 TaxID=2496662 RepID=UPI000FE385BD|nr:hypothetical protein [Mesorhizobium sp. M4B.F.Ca.ET.089.01.1.1]RWX62183.1 hypothetical protein EN780_27380 [Mesorhizobium sp. M4B.F.Ca.ET.089.01.1.1]